MRFTSLGALALVLLGVSAPVLGAPTPMPQSGADDPNATAPNPTAPDSAPQGAVPTPSEHLGRPLGADFTLADWREVSSYHRRLAETCASVQIEKVGTTTEGRDFLLTTISSPENLSQLPQLKQIAARIADPRGLDAEQRAMLTADPVPFLFISVAMHSNECAGPQFGMRFAHELATSTEEPWVSAREKLVVFLTPCLNPDGVDHVTQWYRENVGTPYESTDLLELYQLYAGHDNNRDWFGLALEETRTVTRLLYSEIFPQVYWDVHQQGGSRERFFVPPYRDPLNPNLDPGVITGIDALGSRALFDLTREGLTGVSTGVTYDMWWNGGNRNVPVRHNIIGLLTEAASANLGSPVFVPRNELSAPRGLAGYAPSNRFPDPWPGGWWRINDIIDYEMAFGRSLLGSIAREPSLWVERVMESAERVTSSGADDAPRGYLIPPGVANVGALERLIDGMLLGGVDVFTATSEVNADDRTWPAGSIVIPLAQPYGAHVKDLFEAQRYPEGDAPYDVAGWTLPFLFGIERVELHGEYTAQLEPVASLGAALAAFSPSADAAERRSASDGRSWEWALGRAQAGEPVHAVRDDSGDLFLSTEPAVVEEQDEDDTDSDEPEATPLPALAMQGMPRIGLVAPWRGVKNEGWMRWFLDARGIEYQRLRPETLRAGRLADIVDVLVIPSASPGLLERGRSAGSVASDYTRGLDDDGALAIVEFVESGGKLIAIEDSTAFAIDLFGLPIDDVTEEENDFSCPGSVLRVERGVDGDWLGLPRAASVMFSRSQAFELAESEDDESGDQPEIHTLLTYAEQRLLRSGWIQAPDVIAGKAAWMRVAIGEGELHLFGFQPAYRGWTEEAFLLFLRALLLD